MKRQTDRVAKLEQARAERDRRRESIAATYVETVIDYAAANAVTEELLDTALMGREAALRMIIDAIPDAAKRQYGFIQPDGLEAGAAPAEGPSA